MNKQITYILAIILIAFHLTIAKDNFKIHYHFSPFPEYRIGNETDIPMFWGQNNRTYAFGVSYMLTQYYALSIEFIETNWLSNYIYNFEAGFSENNVPGEWLSTLKHHIGGFGLNIIRNIKQGYWNGSSISLGVISAKPTTSPTGYVDPKFNPETLFIFNAKFERYIVEKYPFKFSVQTFYIPEVGFKHSALIGIDSKIKFWEYWTKNK